MTRRHGTLLRSGQSMLPDEATLCATCWMHGVFAAQLTIGNTSFHKLFSVSRDPYNITRASGLRILIDMGGGWRQLTVPSAFEMGLSDCRWIYCFADAHGHVCMPSHPAKIPRCNGASPSTASLAAFSFLAMWCWASANSTTRALSKSTRNQSAFRCGRTRIRFGGSTTPMPSIIWSPARRKMLKRSVATNCSMPMGKPGMGPTWRFARGPCANSVSPPPVR